MRWVHDQGLDNIVLTNSLSYKLSCTHNHCPSFVNSLQVDILEETTRYILSLEQKLLEKVREYGLPEKLVKMKDKHIVSDDQSDNEDAKDNIDMNMMKCILHKFAQPEIERRLEDQKIEDDKQISEILETGRQ